MDFFKIVLLWKIYNQIDKQSVVNELNKIVTSELGSLNIPYEVKSGIDSVIKETEENIDTYNQIANASNELRNTKSQAYQYSESRTKWDSAYKQLEPYIKRLEYWEKSVEASKRKISGIVHEYSFYLKNKKEKEQINLKNDLPEILDSFSLFKK